MLDFSHLETKVDRKNEGHTFDYHLTTDGVSACLKFRKPKVKPLVPETGEPKLQVVSQLEILLPLFEFAGSQILPWHSLHAAES